MPITGVCLKYIELGLIIRQNKKTNIQKVTQLCPILVSLLSFLAISRCVVPFKFSQPKSLTLHAADFNSGKPVVILDGRPVSTSYNEITNLGFTSDSKDIYYNARLGNQVYYIEQPVN